MFEKISRSPFISLDHETTGLYPFKKDTSFGFAVSDLGVGSYHLTTDDNIRCLKLLLKDYRGTVFMHNAKFDMAFTEKLGIPVSHLDIHCTMAMGRLQDSDALSLSLDSLAGKIGYAKSDEVKKYANKNKLFDWILRPGKKKREKNFHYDLVPYDIMEPYAIRDAEITTKLGVHQLESNLPQKVLENEKRLTHVFYRMEKIGIKIDRVFVEKAWEHEKRLAKDAMDRFCNFAKTPEFKDSGKLFAAAFEGEEIFKTEKGNPSFNADSLKMMKSPLAREIEAYRKHHARAGTYESLLYYADDNDILHANARQAGCATGRVSYSDPPLQCMEKVEKDDPEYSNDFLIRKSFIPRPGYFFVMIDFDQFEYRMMANYARQYSLIEKVNAGMDVHQATAEMLGVSRKQAKCINFSLLYGSGVQRLADQLGIDRTAAGNLKDRYFYKLPKVQAWVKKVHQKIKSTGEVSNWLGRRYSLPEDLAYKAPNYLIQGGCADWLKVAMVRIDEFLADKESRLLLQIHDELLLEISDNEKWVIQEIKNIMENVTHEDPHSLLHYTAGVDYSYKSWHDKEPWPMKDHSAQA